MAYIKTIWENDVTPLDEDNMNHIENGIKANEDKIQILEQQVSGKSKIADADFNSKEDLDTFFEHHLAYFNEGKILNIILCDRMNDMTYQCIYNCDWSQIISDELSLYYISNGSLVLVNLNNLSPMYMLFIQYRDTAEE